MCCVENHRGSKPVIDAVSPSANSANSVRGLHAISPACTVTGFDAWTDLGGFDNFERFSATLGHKDINGS